MTKKTKRKALGRGLEALIPRDHGNRLSLAGQEQSEQQKTGFLECPLNRLHPNEGQPRQGFDPEKLRELTESVKAHGVLQPILVRQLPDGYQIVAGERRWRAAKMAGLEKVPVVVKELSPSEELEASLIENIQREDLNPIEEAEAYQQLIDEHGLTQEAVARKVGKQRSSVANLLRLLRLPAEVKTFLLTGQIGMGHARAILGMVGSRAQASLARRVVDQQLSVRQCEALVRAVPSAKKTKASARASAAAHSPDELRLIESLQRRLGTKIDLKPGKKGGKMVIHYFTSGDLDRIIQVIEGS